MARIRKIDSKPKGERNYYLIDACFLANKYIPLTNITDSQEHKRVSACRDWWKAIDRQVKNNRAIIYISDICIAEAFKVLAKKYYVNKIFKYNQYKQSRDRLSHDLRTEPKELKVADRKIRYHDISTNRDIIISVDRFFPVFLKNNLSVSVPDLVILATAKYLIDFYDIPAKLLHIVTMDRDLWKGCKKIYDIPNAYDPTDRKDAASRIFR